jgi:hypothetical protein
VRASTWASSADSGSRCSGEQQTAGEGPADGSAVAVMRASWHKALTSVDVFGQADPDETSTDVDE